MDQRRRLTELAIGLIVAVFLIVTVGAVVPDKEPTYHYDVAFTPVESALADISAATGSTVTTIGLDFDEAPYAIDFGLTWTPNPGGAGAETLTITLMDPDGATVQSANSASGTVQLSVDIATIPTTLGPFEAPSRADSVAEAAAYMPEDAPAIDGWTVQIQRTAAGGAVDDATAGRATSWTLSTDYTTIQGEATAIEKVANGLSTKTAVLITTGATSLILLVWAGMVITKLARYQGSTVEGWDRPSERTKYDRTERRK